MDTNLFTPSVTVGIAAFSLAWFVVGLFAGTKLRAKTQRKSRKRKPRKQRRQNTKSTAVGNEDLEMYVGNLAYSVSETDLQKAFSRFGKVTAVRIIENRSNGKSKGFGFVEMADMQGLDKAIKSMHGKEKWGRRLIVNAAKSQPR